MKKIILIAILAVFFVGYSYAEQVTKTQNVKPDVKLQKEKVAVTGDRRTTNGGNAAKNVNAGGLPDDMVGEGIRQEQSQYKMTRVPGLDYDFDGGVFIGGAKDFPKKRWNFPKQLEQKEGELIHVIKDKNLYNFIGKHIQPRYNDIAVFGYNPNNTHEIGISFKVNDKYYVAFKKIDPSILSLIDSYDKR
ncbi:hypothetical protein ACFL43_04090 [Thermodesulfobacteriota bacterium]